MSQQQEIARLKRLKAYIQTLGGYKGVVQQSGISSAQLYRYLQGTPIPHERLLQLAQLGGVSTDWLLHGDKPSTVQLESILDIVGEVSRVVQSALQLNELSPTCRPGELKELIPLFVINELNYRRVYPQWRMQEVDVIKSLQNLQRLRRTASLTNYKSYVQALYLSDDKPLTEEWSAPLCSLVDDLNAEYFESFAGQKYYERVAYNIKPEAEVWLQNLIQALEQSKFKGPLAILDFGSGTGRYLRYLYQRYPEWLKLRGIERSKLATPYHQGLYERGELPKSTILLADWLTMEIPKAEVHAVTSYMSLHYQPLVEKSYKVGVGRMLWQMAQCLKPHGIMQLIVRQGLKEVYLPYYSRGLNERDITALLLPLGLTPIKSRPNIYHNNVPPGQKVPMGFEFTMELIYQKVA